MVILSTPACRGLRLAAAFLLLLVAGCNSAAPTLPPDTTGTNRVASVRIEDFSPSDAAMSCADIAAERLSISTRMQAVNDSVAASRPPGRKLAWNPISLASGDTAIDFNDSQRDEMKALYARQDTLIKLAGVKSCPSGTALRS